MTQTSDDTTLTKNALVELERRNLVISVFGEDYDLQSTFRGNEARGYISQQIAPPPFPFSLISNEQKIPKQITEKLTQNIETKLQSILDYSTKCTGLAFKTSPGYLAEEDFIDITRLYLSEIYGLKETPKIAQEIAQAVGIEDNHKLHISKIPLAETYLASVFLKEVINKKLLHYFYLAEITPEFTLSQDLIQLDISGSVTDNAHFFSQHSIKKYYTDALCPKDLTLPLKKIYSGTPSIRMVVENTTHLSLLSGAIPPEKFSGHYQLHLQHF